MTVQRCIVCLACLSVANELFENITLTRYVFIDEQESYFLVINCIAVLLACYWKPVCLVSFDTVLLNCRNIFERCRMLCKNDIVIGLRELRTC